jgi:sulfhydrogenase subunit alpha
VTHGSSPSAHGAIRIPGLARVEGEGGLEIRLRDGEVVEARLNIYEPPRFFEAFLRGRRHTEPPDITARICGICPIAYQMSACRAVEDACGVTVDGPIAKLRRLIYLGEWIESHALHVYLLHAPDFLGYESAVHMAADHRDVVEHGLAMKKAGNGLMEAIGGRSVHPINVRVGGFYRAPTRDELRALLGPLERARDIAVDTVRWVSAFAFPAFERDYGFVSLRHPTDYPISEGRIVSSDGLDIAVAEYDEHFVEEQVPAVDCLALATAVERGPLPCRAARPVQPEHRPSGSPRPPRGPPGRHRGWLQEPVPEHRGPGRRARTGMRRGHRHHRVL